MLGALEFKHKTASDVMTPINNVFMLEIKSILDFKTMMKIAQSGHSRIPVYEGDQKNIIGLLFVKDLIFHDADDKIPLSTIVKFYNHHVKSVYFDTTLDKILNEFKTGKTHLAIVIRLVLPLSVYKWIYCAYLLELTMWEREIPSTRT